jgi:hypothetical protein
LARARVLAREWADALLQDAPSAWRLVGLPEPSNVTPLREAA